MTLSATARDVDRSDPGRRAWVARAIRAVQADANRSADTHLLPVQLPQAWGIELYLKDESTHPSGSLKHRLARSLFLYALCNGWVGPDTPIIEASSGSTAVSEAWFARLLGLEFIAVMPRSTSQTKIDLIERNGGRCEFIDDPATLYPTAVELARRLGGHYMDQFTYAERATDWRGNNNIAESIFDQLRLEPHPAPAWIVTAAGTGGTSATIGRHLRYGGHLTRLCVTDPENSAFFDGWCDADVGVTTCVGSRIEGIGRPRVEPSFVAGVVDRMISVPDAASIAGIHVLRSRTGLFAGGSTGTNLFGALKLVCEMRARGEHGSVVTLLCDGGGRYADSYYSRDWLSRKGLDVDRWVPTFERAWEEGVWVEP
ncbi:PLP-dependent cysteine synthase family protein [uncultured Arsenicicoccus sp.]|uniref:PLP-dependent cysteine synthase family protein n=1 Tax=uncultured Arsenicicoccus sp. TaxID=491339 RepID=UPI0025997C4D|nr:PLP-dependent cysteine synthase family protein [uncultured Arsenicicoccus sp.]